MGATPVRIKHHWISVTAPSKLDVLAAARWSSCPTWSSAMSFLASEKNVGMATSRMQSTDSLNILLEAMTGQWVLIKASQTFGRLSYMMVSNTS